MNSNNYVIAKEEKNQLLLLCLPKLKEFFKNKQKTMKSLHVLDAIESIEIIEEFGVIEYKTSFFILIAMLSEFMQIKSDVLSGKLSFSNLANPYFWVPKNITYEISIYFTSTYLSELFSDKISLDYKKLENLNTIEEYMVFRNNLIEEKTI